MFLIDRREFALLIDTVSNQDLPSLVVAKTCTEGEIRAELKLKSRRHISLVSPSTF